MFKRLLPIVLACASMSSMAEPAFFPKRLWQPQAGNSIYGPVPQCKKLDYAIVAEAMKRIQEFPISAPFWSAGANCFGGASGFTQWSTCQWYIDTICQQVEAQRDAAKSPFSQ